VLTASTAPSLQSARQERKLKLKPFKDAPVVIHKVRNLQSDEWHKDLEIEIKNISGKPIYFMLAYLIFPDQPTPSGGQAGIRLVYGDPKRNGHIDRYSNPEDEHLKPGETYVFTIPEIDRKGLAVRHKKFPEGNNNFVLELAIINFGDGTGFIAGQSRDYRGRSLAPSPPKEQKFRKISWSSTTTNTAAQDGCGVCFRWLVDPDPVPTSCYCRSTILATASPSEPCSRLKLVFFDCNADGNYDCYDDAIDTEASASCTGALPTPTPTPTPEPSPGCPPESTKPNPRCYCAADTFTGALKWECGPSRGNPCRLHESFLSQRLPGGQVSDL
jgi:hypothetical protein